MGENIMETSNNASLYSKKKSGFPNMRSDLYLTMRAQEDLKISKDALQETIRYFSSHKDFPNLYCNVASNHLLKLLKQKWKKVRIQYSYKEPGDAHAYVIQTLPTGKEVIIDPTYAQYDVSYTEGLIAEKFPDLQLEKNRIEGKELVQKQRERYEQGVYLEMFPQGWS